MWQLSLPFHCVYASTIYYVYTHTRHQRSYGRVWGTERGVVLQVLQRVGEECHKIRVSEVGGVNT